MSKEYLRESFRLAFSDYQLAADQESREKALATMAHLTGVASDLYGFEFADSLREECCIV